MLNQVLNVGGRASRDHPPQNLRGEPESKVHFAATEKWGLGHNQERYLKVVLYPGIYPKLSHRLCCF
jgi:hypothetical protein